jgi:hypothetical protein
MPRELLDDSADKALVVWLRETADNHRAISDLVSKKIRERIKNRSFAPGGPDRRDP